MYCGIHLKANSHKMLKLSIIDMSLKIRNYGLQLHLPGANELRTLTHHYSDVIMSAMTSQITSISIVCSTICSGTNQRQHHSSASLAFVMVPTGSDESKLRTFQGPFQDQISHYKDFYGEFHNANIPNTPHICGNFLLFSFWDITSDLIGYLFYILKESWQNVHFGIGCLLNW